jgi:tight adherence protein B
MFPGFETVYIIYAGAAITGIMVAEAIYMLYAGGSDRRATINRRMRLARDSISQEQVLIQLRKERAGAGQGARLFSLDRLRDLRTQSGLRMPLPRLLAITSLAALAPVALLAYVGMPAGFALALYPLGWFAIPFLLLKFLRTRRHKIFGFQLPEALELITRGLKAGHPVPVAIAMVGREMPDPIGSEFGMVADEVTYGADMVTALSNMYARVGHEDLPLFVTAVSIQSSSGGNLREILDGLSRTIRERGKLRRKIRAISTEGRMSAYILTAVPVLLACAMMILVPQMYIEVKDEPLTWYLLAGTLFWLGVGNAAMFKMSNFRF